MKRKKYDIFISYRRQGGYETAKHLNDLLVRDGYKVSFDIDTLRTGDFDVQLLERIEQCKDFILIVDKHAFDRTLDTTFDPKNDWLRCELAHALKHKKNIIPVFLSGITSFPEGLPDDIVKVATKHGPEYNKYYFDDFYKKLKSFLKSKSSKFVPWVIFSLLVFVSVIIYMCFSMQEDDIVKYQNPSSPQTTTEEQFYNYAKCYIDTVSIGDKKMSLDIIVMQAHDGDSEAQFRLGLCYFIGHIVEKNVSKAVDLFKQSASQNNAYAQYALAVCYDRGLGVEKDEAQAMDLCSKAANKGIAPAQNDYGIWCGINNNNFEAFKWLEKSAKQNYAPAQYHVAWCYLNAFGVDKDFDKCLSWIQAASDQEYKIAELSLAVFYINGPEDYAQVETGVEMLETLVSEDYIYAYRYLGTLYLKGKDGFVNKDIPKGYELIKKGADKNDVDSKMWIAFNYINPIPGTGVEPDAEIGIKILLELATEQGFPIAQYALGEIYAKGLFGEKTNKEKSEKWYEKAAQQGVTSQQFYNYVNNG